MIGEHGRIITRGHVHGQVWVITYLANHLKLSVFDI